MNVQISVLKKSRELVLKRIENLSHAQLLKVPEGFNNSILWNVCHLVVTQQLLHYKLSGLDCLIPDDTIEAYRKGTTPPKDPMSEEEFEEIKELLAGLPDTLAEDLNEGIFKTYKEYPTSTGFVLHNIEEAINFNNMHEGLHLGVIMSLTKLV